MLLEKGVGGEVSERSIGKVKYKNIYIIKYGINFRFKWLGKKY